MITSQYPQYEALAADWKSTCQTPVPPLALRPVAIHQQSSSISATNPIAIHNQCGPGSVTSPRTSQHRSGSASVHRPVSVHHRTSSASFNNGLSQGLKALKLANGVMNAVNGTGGQSYDSTDYYSDSNTFVDTSDLWQSDQSAANDPIQ